MTSVSGSSCGQLCSFFPGCVSTSNSSAQVMRGIKTGYGKQGIQSAVGIVRSLGALIGTICVRVAYTRAEIKQGSVCTDAKGLSGIDGTDALFCSTTFDLPNKTYPHPSFHVRFVQLGWRPLCLTSPDNDIKYRLPPLILRRCHHRRPRNKPPTSTIHTHCHFITSTPSLRVPKPSWQGTQYKTH